MLLVLKRAIAGTKRTGSIKEERPSCPTFYIEQPLISLLHTSQAYTWYHNWKILFKEANKSGYSMWSAVQLLNSCRRWLYWTAMLHGVLAKLANPWNIEFPLRLHGYQRSKWFLDEPSFEQNHATLIVRNKKTVPQGVYCRPGFASVFWGIQKVQYIIHGARSRMCYSILQISDRVCNLPKKEITI